MTLSGKKTLIYNLVLLVLTLADLFINDGTVLSTVFSDPAHAAVALVVLKVGNIILRFWTTTPMLIPAEKPAPALPRAGDPQ